MSAKNNPPFEIVGGTLKADHLPPIALRALKIIRALPDRQLINQNELAVRLKSRPSSCRDLNWAIPDEIKTKDRHGHRLYGNAKTIKAFNRWLRDQ